MTVLAMARREGRLPVLSARIATELAEGFQKLGGDDAAARIDAELQRTHFLVDILHKEHDEVDQPMLQHCLGVVVRDQKADVVA